LASNNPILVNMRSRTWFKEKPRSPNTRDSALPGFVHPRNGRAGDDPDGFSLLEMMMVVTVILIVASIATPIYTSVVTRAREAVLSDHLKKAVSSQPSAISEHTEN